MSFTFSQTAGTSGETIITVSATSREELETLVENFTLSNDNESLLMPIAQKGEVPSEEYLTISPSAITFPSSGGNQVVVIQSNVNWTWDMDEWITASIHSGTSGNTMIPITASENTGSSRTSEIKVSGNTLTASTTASQAGNYVKPYIMLDYYSYSCSAESATTSITVTSNVDWYTVASERWITINTQSGSGDGTISFEVSENTGDLNRSGLITVNNDDQDLHVQFVILQATAAKPYIILVPSAFTVSSTGSTGNTIDITANCDYDIEADVDWITVSSSSGSGIGSVSFTTAPSDRATSNVGNIEFSNSALSRYVTVERQSVEKYLSANTTTLNFDSENPEPIEVSVYSNISWQVSIDEGAERSWLSVTPVSGNGNGVISVSATSGGMRTSTILLYNSEYGLSWTINVEQRYGNNVIIYTTTDEQPLSGIGKQFGATLVSNTYDNGIGLLMFDRPVTSIDIYSNVSGAFANQSRLNNIIIPDSVTYIGMYAFLKCSNLTEITIPSGVTSFGNYAFSGCTGLTKLYWNTSQVTGLDRVFSYMTQNLSEIIIGDDVTSIPSHFCENLHGLRTVEFSDLVTQIPQACFSASGIEEIIIPDTIEVIDYYAFCKCTGLTSVTIGSSVNNIKYGSFSGDTNLREIYCYPVNPPIVNTPSPFDGCPQEGTFHYPAGSDYSSWRNTILPYRWTLIGDL